MKKAGSKSRVTDEDIRSYDNVPVAVAAEYLGVSVPTVRRALQQGKTNLGFAVAGSGSRYDYHISPGGLIKYKREGSQPMSMETCLRMLSTVMTPLQLQNQSVMQNALTDRLSRMENQLSRLEQMFDN